jgi:hypothetical protein
MGGFAQSAQRNSSSRTSSFETTVCFKDAGIMDTLGSMEDYESRKQRVIEAVSLNGRALQKTSRDMRRDKEVVRLAVKNNPAVFWCVDPQLRNNRAFVLNLVNTIPCGRYVLEYVPPAFWRDANIIFAAVSRDGLALMWASEKLQDTERIVEAAVKSNGLALKYASPRLCNSLRVVILALANNGHALRFAPPKLRDSLQVVEMAVWSHPGALEHASQRIRDHWFTLNGTLRRRSVYDRITTRR